jgi:hypothetical protein
VDDGIDGGTDGMGWIARQGGRDERIEGAKGKLECWPRASQIKFIGCISLSPRGTSYDV